MLKTVNLPGNIEVTFTDEPDSAAKLAASGSCFITLAGIDVKADSYVTCEQDFDELTDEYLKRIYARHIGTPYILFSLCGYELKECDKADYSFVTKLFEDNREALTGFEDSLWTDDIEAAEQFEKTVREYYALCDFGIWILKKDGEGIGIFGMSAEDEGPELYYILKEEYRHKGIAAAVCEKILEYAAEELGLEKIYITCMEKNKPSRRLAEGLGFNIYSSEGEGTITKLKFIKEL